MEGKILYAALKYPGSWHNVQDLTGRSNVVKSRIGVYALYVEQGFPRSGELNDQFVGPISGGAIV